MKSLLADNGESTENINININTVGILSRRITNNSPKRMFECKTCNRQFPSFQALGGHRASHRKLPHIGFIETQLQAPLEPTKPRIHECSICGLEFPLGQALGGHMRRHSTNNNNNNKNKNKYNVSKQQVVSGLNLDLNLVPPEIESEADHRGHEGGVDLELQLDLDLAEKVRFVEWLH